MINSLVSLVIHEVAGTLYSMDAFEWMTWGLPYFLHRKSEVEIMQPAEWMWGLNGPVYIKNTEQTYINNISQ